VLSTALGAAPRALAETPSRWCGTDEAATDRPDIVAGQQVHVIYAYPPDVPDRFTDVAPLIVRDIAAIDEWWRGQDPTRTPRFDLAAFPGCDSKFGTLDLSSVRLSQSAPSDSAQFVSALRADLGAFKDPSKAYLVYADVAAPQGVCGVTSPVGPAFSIVYLLGSPFGCGVAALGQAGIPAITAAHELVHAFDNVPTNPPRPNACPGDPGHVCDNRADLMEPRPSFPSLARVVLDSGHDDYYAHTGSWWDVRNSPFLAHLDGPQYSLSLSVTAPGEVTSNVPGISCPMVCANPFDAGTTLILSAQQVTGYAFDGWAGACFGDTPSCTLTIDAPKIVTARYAALVRVALSTRGPGSVDGDLLCAHRCSFQEPPHSQLTLHAQPDKDAHFVEWRGACHGNRRRCSVTARKAKTVTAVFER
jgi:hypothetical protein